MDSNENEIHNLQTGRQYERNTKSPTWQVLTLGKTSQNSILLMTLDFNNLSQLNKLNFGKK